MTGELNAGTDAKMTARQAVKAFFKKPLWLVLAALLTVFAAAHLVNSVQVMSYVMGNSYGEVNLYLLMDVFGAVFELLLSAGLWILYSGARRQGDSGAAKAGGALTLAGAIASAVGALYCAIDTAQGDFIEIMRLEPEFGIYIIAIVLMFFCTFVTMVFLALWASALLKSLRLSSLYKTGALAAGICALLVTVFGAVVLVVYLTADFFIENDFMWICRNILQSASFLVLAISAFHYHTYATAKNQELSLQPTPPAPAVPQPYMGDVPPMAQAPMTWQPPLQPSAPPAQGDGKRFCPYCGQPLIPGSAFCSRCGKPVEE